MERRLPSHRRGRATGRNEAYYIDYEGSPQEFISAAKHGFLYQGQYYTWQKQRRGTPTAGIEPKAFVAFIENHDQVANSATGGRTRANTSAGRLRAMTALLLLGPWTPMLFQGQEFAASTPFLYFTDVAEELHAPIRKGRLDFLRQFPSIVREEKRRELADPFDPQTFERCKLHFSDRKKNTKTYRLHEDLLRLRREDPLFAAQAPHRVDGAVLGPASFILRFFGPDADDRILIVNFGGKLRLDPMPAPLLAPPTSTQWEIEWSSDSTLYGGAGLVPLDEFQWQVPREAAVVYRPVTNDESDRK